MAGERVVVSSGTVDEAGWGDMENTREGPNSVDIVRTMPMPLLNGIEGRLVNGGPAEYVLVGIGEECLEDDGGIGSLLVCALVASSAEVSSSWCADTLLMSWFTGLDVDVGELW